MPPKLDLSGAISTPRCLENRIRLKRCPIFVIATASHDEYPKLGKCTAPHRRPPGDTDNPGGSPGQPYRVCSRRHQDPRIYLPLIALQPHVKADSFVMLNTPPIHYDIF